MTVEAIDPEQRLFIKPATVNVTITVMRVGTRQNLDVDMVDIIKFKLEGGELDLPTPSVFTHEGVGVYSLAIDTTGLEAGVYDVVIRVSNGASAIVVVTDRFALEEP